MATMTYEKLQKFHSRMLRKQGDKILDVRSVNICRSVSEPLCIEYCTHDCSSSSSECDISGSEGLFLECLPKGLCRAWKGQKHVLQISAPVCDMHRDTIGCDDEHIFLVHRCLVCTQKICTVCSHEPETCWTLILCALHFSAHEDTRPNQIADLQETTQFWNR